MTHTRRPLIALLAAATTALTAGCLPSRIVLDLDPNERDLDQTKLIDQPGSDRVALIDLQGTIALDSSPASPFSTGPSVVDAVVTRLQRAEDDDRIKAIVLRINSPGGTVAASESLADEIERFKQRTGKPVVAVMTEIATSGAYYVALAADNIHAQQGTTTGSIGVLIQTLNLSRGMDMIGIEGRTVVSAHNKDIANPFQPIDDNHYDILQTIVDNFYDAFRERVRDARPTISPADFDTLTDGRVLPAELALEAGLIDTIGSVRDAFQHAKQLADIENADLITYHTRGNAPASLYSNAKPTHQQPISTTTFSLVPTPKTLRPGIAYYIWSPATP